MKQHGLSSLSFILSLAKGNREGRAKTTLKLASHRDGPKHQTSNRLPTFGFRSRFLSFHPGRNLTITGSPHLPLHAMERAG